MANTLDAFYNILKDDATVQGLLDDGSSGIKLAVNKTRQGIQPPFAIHKIQDSDPTDTKDGVSTLDVDRYIIAFFATSDTSRNAIREAVRSALDRFSGVKSSVNIDKIIYENKQDFYDEEAELFQGEDDYRVRIKR